MSHRPSKPTNLLHLLLVAALLAGLMFSLAPLRVAHAATFIVNTAADTTDVNPGNGICADSSGKCSLRAAISEANALAGDDTITLPAGTYTLTLAGASEDANATGDLDFTTGITLNGVGASSTIIDANQLDRVVQVFAGTTVTLNGVTLRNGKSPASGGQYCWGGGVYNRGTLTITDSAVSDNVTGSQWSSAGCNGGGVYTAGTLEITNSTISRNKTGDGGGGGHEGGRGGGVYIHSGTTTIQNSTISGNATGNGSVSEYGGHGGGVCNDGGTLEITNSTISGNTTGNGGTSDGSGGGSGGGVRNVNGTLTIRGSVIRDNVAGDGDHGGSGGGVDTSNSSSGSMTIQDSTLSGNRSGAGGSGNGVGGGLDVGYGTHTLTNTTISGNVTKGFGGGILITNATLTLAHCTITANTDDAPADDGAGGGIDSQYGTLAFKNTIVAGNHDTADPSSADCRGTQTSLGYNLVGSSTGCAHDGTGDQTTPDAKLGPLQDNGGPTKTHALLFGSPALEVIPNGTNGCGTTYTTDQRGAARPGGGACDVGAYESPNSFWDGGGGDNNTSTAANWSGDALPDATDIATFWSGSSKNATVDAGLHVGGWLVDSGYGGTISQGSSSLTVDGDWTQAGGTFTGGSGALDLEGAFNLSGGAFTAPSGLMTIAGVFNHTGGTFNPNGGRVVLASTTNQTLATTFNDLTLNDGLLGYWKLDEGSGSTAADSSGYGHGGVVTGTLWSSATPATMDFHDPYAFRSNRTDSSEYVLASNMHELDGAQTLTLSAWVRLDSLPANTMRFITIENEKAVLRYTSGGGLEFYVKIGGSIRSTSVSGVLSTTGQWYHVAGTYDGSTLRLYLDGTERDNYAVSGSVATGSWVRLSHSANDAALDGLLDDARIYNRALSAAEVSDLAAGKHPNTSQATTTLGAALDVNGDLTLDSGTLDVSASNYGINLAGDFTRNGGVFTAHSGTVTFDGTVTQTLDTDAITFYNLAVNSGATLVTQRNFNANGTLTNNGTLQQTKNVVTSGAAFLWFGGYGGVSISGANLGNTTVTIKGNQDCTTTHGETVLRCFDIAPTTTGGSARVQFYFAGSELSGNDCNALNAYHRTGSAWQLLPLDTSWGVDGRVCPGEDSAPYSVRVYPVTEFSPFVLKSGSPLAVRLAAFTAAPGGGGVRLTWETVSELDNLGFHLYRVAEGGDVWLRLDAALIPSQAPGAAGGYVYTWLDRGAQRGTTYRYRLEAVGLSGQAQRLDETTVCFGAALWLPTVVR
ncbi:MAG: LamG domain-containing protein [Chloroflexi bacterium]|nr:LamG domain-containing protein [Chloroflexota bacterium]